MFYFFEFVYLDFIFFRLLKNLLVGGFWINNLSLCLVWGLCLVLGILCKGSIEDSWLLNDGELLWIVEEGWF